MLNPIRAIRRGALRLALRHGPQRHILVPVYYIISPPRNPHPLPDLRTAQHRLLQLTNHLRRRSSLRSVKLSSSLSHIAERHSQYQGSKAKATHKGRHGFRLTERLKEAQFDFRYAGENVASGHRTVDEAFRSWYRSKGHRRNLLSSKVDLMGLGVSRGWDGRLYWTQLFASR
ncbi:Cysteine-rich secretory protein [Gracilaria domingensis]|nr:Cysteine-rich secretory protein [Gracilaria domingensis]